MKISKFEKQIIRNIEKRMKLNYKVRDMLVDKYNGMEDDIHDLDSVTNQLSRFVNYGCKNKAMITAEKVLCAEHETLSTMFNEINDLIEEIEDRIEADENFMEDFEEIVFGNEENS